MHDVLVIPGYVVEIYSRALPVSYAAEQCYITKCGAFISTVHNLLQPLPRSSVSRGGIKTRKGKEAAKRTSLLILQTQVSIHSCL